MFSLNSLVIHPSRTLLCLYNGVHILALFSVFYSSIPFFAQSVISMIVLVSFLFNYKTLVTLQALWSITLLSWNSETRSMWLEQFDGTRLDVVALKQVTVLPFAVCLFCRVEERYFDIPVFIFMDSCSKDNFRRLRVLALHSSVSDAD